MRGRRPSIFLNYAREDEIPVTRVYQKLAAAGLSPWMDIQDIRPGDEWRESINSAIDNCAYFLAFLSARSVQKAGVLREEIEAARRRRSAANAPLRVIPVRLERCEVPAELSDLQWIDLFDPNGWDRLLGVLPRPRRAWRIAAWTAIAAASLAAIIWATLHHKTGFATLRGNVSAQEAMIGASFWRLQPWDASKSPGIRSIFQPPPNSPEKPMEYTAARIAPESQLKTGDRFYVSIECTRAGYVYVIDQERYAGARAGSPELIFPTRRTRGGDNFLAKDALMRLPAPDDNPPWFEVQAGDRNYEGEIFTVIVLPQPIPGFSTPADHAPVREDQFSTWKREWRRPATLVASDSTQNLITEAESRAHSALQPVVQSEQDPVPATIYRVQPGLNGALWADFALRVSR